MLSSHLMAITSWDLIRLLSVWYHRLSRYLYSFSSGWVSLFLITPAYKTVNSQELGQAGGIPCNKLPPAQCLLCVPVQCIFKYWYAHISVQCLGCNVKKRTITLLHSDMFTCPKLSKFKWALHQTQISCVLHRYHIILVVEIISISPLFERFSADGADCYVSPPTV